MISLDEARQTILDDLDPVGKETLSIFDAHGRTLAADIIAGRTQPSFRASAMDGYAVRSADLGDTPARLKCLGESAAGYAFDGVVSPGTTVRISTGAPMPEGADQVVMREDTTLAGDEVILDVRPRPDRHVRAAGVDFNKGDTLIMAGTRLDALALSLAASAGVLWPVVHSRPVVAILTTGDELVEPGQPLKPSQIINSNTTALMTLIAELGGKGRSLGIIPDTRDAVREAFRAGSGADLIVTIGGASVGEHDHLRAVFSEAGGTLAFEKIAVKPGKPTWYGRISGVPVLGLPGNPVSALVMAKLLLGPAMTRLGGETTADTYTYERVRLSEGLPANGPRELFLRAVFDSEGTARRTVRSLTNQDSSALSALVSADCLIRRAGNASACKTGEDVEIVLL